VKNFTTETLSAQIARLTAVGSRLFFQPADATHRQEVRTSGGPAAGTPLVTDILTGPFGAFSESLCGVGCREMVGMNGFLFFTPLGPGGIALWRGVGPPAGTAPLQTT